MRKNILIGAALLIVSIPTIAGGFLTNTNQNVLFLRMLARDASTRIDAVYSNPAGLAYIEGGNRLRLLSLNVQSAYQTRQITSTFAPFLPMVYRTTAAAPSIQGREGLGTLNPKPAASTRRATGCSPEASL